MGRLPGAVVACVALLGAASLACGSCEKTEERARLEGPVKVVFTAERRWGGGRLPGLTWSGKLSVERDGRQFSRSADCYEPTPALAGDGTAERFAYRCDPVHQWHAVYVTDLDVFRVCNRTLGNDDAPDWSKIPADSRAGFDAIAECADRYYGDEQKHLIDHAKALGDEYVVRLLVLQLDKWLFSPWEAVAADLSTNAKALLRKELEKALAQPLDKTRTCRALSQLPDTSLAPHAAPLLTRAAALVDEGKPAPCLDQLERLLVALRNENPKQAAQLTCTLFARPPLLVRKDSFLGIEPTTREALQALPARSCPQLWEPMLEIACNEDFMCDGRACTEGEVEQALSSYDEPPADPKGYQRYSRLELLRIAYAQGPLPDNLKTKLGRLAYATHLDASCPPRRDWMSESTRACCTESGARDTACELGDRPTKTYERLCELRVDDAERLISSRWLAPSDAGPPAPSPGGSAALRASGAPSGSAPDATPPGN
ncbi:MAG: hypothetical protein KC766_16540 [Myxococcales bacterium]|nr:hypothetical protein [Myxococcales bacterium]